MKIVFRIPKFFIFLTFVGCFLMTFGLLEVYFKFLPEYVWKYTPLVCIVLGLFLIIPHHFLALIEILKYRPKNDN